MREGEAGVHITVREAYTSEVQVYESVCSIHGAATASVVPPHHAHDDDDTMFGDDELLHDRGLPSQTQSV